MMLAVLDFIISVWKKVIDMKLIKNKKKLEDQILSLQKENERLRDIVCCNIDENTKLLKSICSKLEIDTSNYKDQTEAELMKQLLKPILIHVLANYDIERNLIIRKQNTIRGTIDEREVVISFKYKHDLQTTKDFNIYTSEEGFQLLQDLLFEIRGGLII